MRVLPPDQPLRGPAYVWGRLASLPPAEKATYRYEDSSRYYRARVLAALREAPEEGVPLRELGQGLREGFGQEDLPWIRNVVESLKKDGLAVIEEERPKCPGVVAEERSAYGAGAAAGEQAGSAEADVKSSEARVRLP